MIVTITTYRVGVLLEASGWKAVSPMLKIFGQLHNRKDVLISCHVRAFSDGGLPSTGDRRQRLSLRRKLQDVGVCLGVTRPRRLRTSEPDLIVSTQ